MVAKSIVSVDVDDAKFKAFKDLFDKYQAQLEKMPEAWKAASAEQQGLMRGFANVTAAMLAHNDIARKTASEGHRGATETDRQAKSWHSIARDSKEVAGNVASMTRSFVKWTGLTTLFTGLLGGGSLWGFTHLAGSVAALRQSAAGFGITPGQGTAFGVDFGRFLASPQGTLSAVAAALSDPTSPAYRPIAALLGNVQGRNAADVSSQLLQALPRLFPGGAKQQNLGTVAEAYGLTNILSVEDIRRYLSASPEERTRQEGAYREDIGRFEPDPVALRKYQDFETSMQGAGAQIRKIFIDGLAPLTGPLTNLSKETVHLVDVFMGAVKDKHWIEQISTGIHDFADVIKDGKLDHTVKDIVDDLEWFGSKLKWITSFLPGPDIGKNIANDILGPQQDIDAVKKIWNMGTDFLSGRVVSEWGKQIGKFTSRATDPIASALARRDITGSPLTTITTAGGHKVTVSASGADRFKGFLDAMEAAGAPITSLGGYNPRKIAGTPVWSQHAFGRAIDVDQSARDVVTKEFRAWAQTHADLLRKIETQYGIKSGGDFRGKPDFGHFELSKGYERERTPKVEITKATGADVNVSMQQLATYGVGLSGPLP